MQPDLLLHRFLELVDGSESYFVTGSFSFLPLLDDYRLPQHDLDIAVALPLFHRIQGLLHQTERARILRLGEIAVANTSPIARIWSPRTSFVHVSTDSGLLDLACYRASGTRLRVSLGPGLRLELPGSVLDRVKTVAWRGIAYRAAPVELAFIPKAVGYIRADLPPHHLVDLQQLARIVDWEFIAELLTSGGLRVVGRRLPRFLAGRLDPFTPQLLNLAGERFGATD